MSNEQLTLDEQGVRKIRLAALDDVQRYDDLRANALQIVELCDKRLQLLGVKRKETAIPLLSIEETMTTPSNGNSRPLRSCIEEVLAESTRPLSAREVWELSYKLGARTNSNNPKRLTDTMLRDLVKKGRVVQPERGRYAKV